MKYLGKDLIRCITDAHQNPWDIVKKMLKYLNGEIYYVHELILWRCQLSLNLSIQSTQSPPNKQTPPKPKSTFFLVKKIWQSDSKIHLEMQKT